MNLHEYEIKYTFINLFFRSKNSFTYLLIHNYTYLNNELRFFLAKKNKIFHAKVSFASNVFYSFANSVPCTMKK